MESQLPLSADPTGGSAVPKLEPRHRPPAAPPPAPPRGQQCHEATPPPAVFRITASGAQLWRTRTAPGGDFHPNDARLRRDRNRDRLAWPPERLWRMLLPNISLTSSSASPPHGCPGPSTPPTNARATRARSARPASVTLSRIASSAIRHPGRMYGDALSTQPHTSSRNTRPARPVRGCPWKANGSVDRPGGRTPSAICPWTPRHAGPQRYKVTHGGTEKKRPA